MNVNVVGFKFQVNSNAKMPLDNLKNTFSFPFTGNLILCGAATAISAVTSKMICSLKTKHL